MTDFEKRQHGERVRVVVGLVMLIGLRALYIVGGSALGLTALIDGEWLWLVLIVIGSVLGYLSTRPLARGLSAERRRLRSVSS